MLGFREKKFVVFFKIFPILGIVFVVLSSTGIVREVVVNFDFCYGCLIVEGIKCLDNGIVVFLRLCP